MKGIELIKKEQEEQREKHGYDVDHDAELNQNTQLRRAAIYCLTLDEKWYPNNWLQEYKDKIREKGYTERLAIAGALLSSEIDRIKEG